MLSGYVAGYQCQAFSYCRHDNVLKHAPHTADVVLGDEWTRPYSRQEAAFPALWVRQAKFWPSASRVDNVYGDRYLVASLQDDTVSEPLVATA